MNAIKKYGIDAFKFQVLIICFDEDRFIYEKQYIKDYKSMVPKGYNITPGGEGGGFIGKNHTADSREKIGAGVQRFNKENPGYFETYRAKWEESMKHVNLSEVVRNSTVFKKAVEERRVGAPAHRNGMGICEETCEKISEGLCRYYESHDGFLEKRRTAIINKVGRKVAQYTPESIFIKEYSSIGQASRDSGVSSKNIGHTLSGRSMKAGGYIWKYV